MNPTRPVYFNFEAPSSSSASTFSFTTTPLHGPSILPSASDGGCSVRRAAESTFPGFRPQANPDLVGWDREPSYQEKSIDGVKIGVIEYPSGIIGRRMNIEICQGPEELIGKTTGIQKGRRTAEAREHAYEKVSDFVKDFVQKKENTREKRERESDVESESKKQDVEPEQKAETESIPSIVLEETNPDQSIQGKKEREFGCKKQDEEGATPFLCAGVACAAPFVSSADTAVQEKKEADSGSTPSVTLEEKINKTSIQQRIKNADQPSPFLSVSNELKLIGLAARKWKNEAEKGLSKNPISSLERTQKIAQAALSEALEKGTKTASRLLDDDHLKEKFSESAAKKFGSKISQAVLNSKTLNPLELTKEVVVESIQDIATESVKTISSSAAVSGFKNLSSHFKLSKKTKDVIQSFSGSKFISSIDQVLTAKDLVQKTILESQKNGIPSAMGKLANELIRKHFETIILEGISVGLNIAFPGSGWGVFLIRNLGSGLASPYVSRLMDGFMIKNRLLKDR